MKKMKLSVLLIVVALSIAAVGSAALSSISFGRNVSAGQVMVDTDENVAIQIINTSNYVGLVKTGTDGKVSFDLNEAINNSVNSGFNADAIFTIGTPTSGVIQIKNNSDIPVTVTLSNDTNQKDVIKLIPTNNSSATIGVGTAGNFYFTLNTNGQDMVKSLNAILHIEGN